MSKGLTPKRHSHDNLSCVPWMNIKVFIQNLVQCLSINRVHEILLWFKNHSDKTNKKIQHNWRNKQWGSNHWNISIIMLYSSTQSESSVFVLKVPWCLLLWITKSLLLQCKTLHHTSWAITVHSSPERLTRQSTEQVFLPCTKSTYVGCMTDGQKFSGRT